jgi:putative transposase
MRRKINKHAISGKSAQSQISAKLLEELIPGFVSKEEFEDILQNFKKAFIERALNAEMSHHLGYGAGQAKPEGVTNHRNGSSAKTVITDTGSVRLEVPREPEGSFEPQLIGKHERRLTGFDDKIIAIYARGMTAREIQGFMTEMYAVDVWHWATLLPTGLGLARIGRRQ